MLKYNSQLGTYDTSIKQKEHEHENETDPYKEKQEFWKEREKYLGLRRTKDERD